MKIIVLFLLSSFSLLFAKTICYDFDDYEGRFNDLIEAKKYIEKDAEQTERNNLFQKAVRVLYFILHQV